MDKQTKTFLKCVGDDPWFLENLEFVTDDMKASFVRKWREKKRKLDRIQERTSSFFA